MPLLVSTNPAKNYEKVGEIAISTDQEIQEKVTAANESKLVWKELGVQKRISFLKRICDECKRRKKELATLIMQETGKTLINAESEVTGYIEEFQWFMNHVEQSLADEITFQDNVSKHRIVYEPLGTAAVITPWNFPFGMAIWGIVPNLLVGNTVVFKISEECPLVGALIEEIMNTSLPQGVFSEVYGAGAVGQKLAESEIDLIWFTGSTKTGRLLYQIAAKKFIKVVLEMGGSNPCIVFDDVNIKEAADRVFSERFYHCGQVCDSIKRLIVHESIFDQFVAQLVAIAHAQQLGLPDNPMTNLSSLVAKRQVELLQEQISDAVKKGAQVVTGGKQPSHPLGAYFEPTLLTGIKRNMRVWNEEVFGPALPIISFSTETEAISLANDTIYGLGSRVFSKDLVRAGRVASKIQAGTVEINQASRWLPCNPFGGYKQSGMGREHGAIGFRELSQIKVISE